MRSRLMIIVYSILHHKSGVQKSPERCKGSVHPNPSISTNIFPDSGQIQADKCPGPGGLAGPDIDCGRNGFPWTPHTREPSGRFCITQSGVFTIFDIARF